MDNRQTIFLYIGLALKIYFYLAPIFPFINILKNLNYKDFPLVLLIITFINCILWTDYGLLNDDGNIYYISAAGGNITLIWIAIYIIFLAKKSFRLSLGFIGLILIIIAYFMSLFYFVVQKETTYCIARIFNILMYAAPGVQIFKFIDTKKYELMPVYSVIGAFLCSLYWLIYDYNYYESDNKFLLVFSNAIASLFPTIQIFAFFFICIKRKSKMIR